MRGREGALGGRGQQGEGGGGRGGLDSPESAGAKEGEPLPLVTSTRMGGGFKYIKSAIKFRRKDVEKGIRIKSQSGDPRTHLEKPPEPLPQKKSFFRVIKL